MNRRKSASKDLKGKSKAVSEVDRGPFNTMKRLLVGKSSSDKPAEKSHQNDAEVFDNVSVTTKDGSISFKLSEIDTFTVEKLAEINLSEGVPDFICADAEDARKDFKNQFDFDTKRSMRLANGTLKESYKYTTYQEHPDIYKGLLKFYIYSKICEHLKYMNLKVEDFSKFANKAYEYRIKLFNYNKDKTRERQNQGEDQPRVTGFNQKKDVKLPHIDPESKWIFSDESMKRAIANEIAVTRAYYNLWPKEREQQPDTDEFQINYARAESIFQVDLSTILPDHLEGFRRTIDEASGGFKRIAEHNPEQFRPALRQAIERARTLNHWATNFTARFDLNEDWVKAGMLQLGIKPENFHESYEKLLANPHITDEISGNRAVNEIVQDYQLDSLVQHYEDFIRANIDLGYIHEQLKEGIPVKFSADLRINGRQIAATSGNDCNCLIHSLIMVGHPKWKQAKIEEEAKPIRKALVDAKLVEHHAFLDLGHPATRELLIKELVKRNLFDPALGLQSYQLHRDRIQYVDIISSSSEVSSHEPRPTIFLQYDWHFSAMLEPPKPK